MSKARHNILTINKFLMIQGNTAPTEEEYQDLLFLRCNALQDAELCVKLLPIAQKYFATNNRSFQSYEDIINATETHKPGAIR